MLYLYYGTDQEQARMRLRSAIERLRTRAPDASYARITPEEAERLDMPDLLGGQGLFYRKRIVVFDGILENTSVREVIMEQLPNMAASEHIFFILEGTLIAPTVKKLEKYAAKVQAYNPSISGQGAAKQYSPFALSDALLTRDSRALWISYCRARVAGHAPESLLGTLFWGAKTLALAARSESPEEAGLKPFVFSKAKRGLKHYRVEEVDALVKNLAILPHEARRTGEGLEYALERFVLGITHITH
jgi:DNA polymerase III delta subunit